MTVLRRSNRSATLAAEDVAFSYGEGERVLDGLSLAVDPGEVVAVIGPSGVGKTTLLRLLALFEPPEAGAVAVDGVEAWAVDGEARLGLRRRIGMVFQATSLFDASVAANVAYGLRVRRSLAARLRNRLPVVGDSGAVVTIGAVSEALETVGMADALDRDAGSLSGGEAQRVAFARAVAFDPDVLLLDEPTSDLDPRNTAVIEEAVGEARDAGMAVVLATHDMHQARRVADRTAVLLDGGITEIGPTDDVFEDPTDERTERFITGKLVY